MQRICTILLLFALSCGAATRVQHNGAATGSCCVGLGATFSTLPTVGNTVVAAITLASSSPSSAPTDNQGNTYSSLASHSYTGGTVEFYSATVATSSGTFTVNVAGGGWSGSFLILEIIEYSGVSNLLDAADFASSSSSSSTVNCGTVSTTVANGAIVASGWSTGSGVSAGTGYSFIDSTNGAGLIDRLPTSTGSFSPTMNLSGSSSTGYICATVALKGPVTTARKLLKVIN